MNELPRVVTRFLFGSDSLLLVEIPTIKRKNGEISKKNHKKRLHLKRFRV